MDAGLLPAYVVFSLIALNIAFAYLVGVASVRRLSAFAWRRRRRLRLEPGEPVRRKLLRNGRRLAGHWHAVLLGLVVFACLALLGQRGWWPDWSPRFWATLAILLLIPQAYGAAKLFELLRDRWRLAQLLQLHDAVAARLGEAELRGNRLHFAVPTEAGPADVVVIGPNGLYLLLLVPPPAGSETVCLCEGRLHFEPGPVSLSTAPMRAVGEAMRKSIAQSTGRRITVQTVLIVPGCQVLPGEDHDLLVVNLPSCISFVGWRNPQACLMDDEIRDIDAWIAGNASIGNDPAEPRAQALLRAVSRWLASAVRRLRPSGA